MDRLAQAAAIAALDVEPIVWLDGEVPGAEPTAEGDAPIAADDAVSREEAERTLAAFENLYLAYLDSCLPDGYIPANPDVYDEALERVAKDLSRLDRYGDPPDEPEGR